MPEAAFTLLYCECEFVSAASLPALPTSLAYQALILRKIGPIRGQNDTSIRSCMIE